MLGFCSSVVELDLAEDFQPDLLKTGAEDAEEMEMPKDEIQRLHVVERSAKSPWRAPGDKAGIKAGRRRTKELLGGLETLRTAASSRRVVATSPSPGDMAKRRDGQERLASSSSFSSFSGALLIN